LLLAISQARRRFCDDRRLLEVHQDRGEIVLELLGALGEESGEHGRAAR
jgi:hypothetical protein